MTKCQKKMNWGFFVTLQIYFRKSILRAKRAKFCLILFNFENWNWIWIFAPKKSITIWPTLGQKFTFYPKIHILKIPIFTKFTSLRSHFSQNSPFWKLNFHKIHIFEKSIFTKFTFLKSHFTFLKTQFSHFWNLIFHKIHIFLKYQNQGNFWIKSGFLPQCVMLILFSIYLETGIMIVQSL